MELASFLKLVADYVKADPDFCPRKDSRTMRWHATVDGRDFCLVITGTKFFDDRTNARGGGAIDLAMHVWGSSFKATVKRMQALGIGE